MTQLELALVPIVCMACGEPIDADNEYLDVDTCTSCYVNESCPAQCNDDHDAPSFREADGCTDWECPTDGSVWYYIGPNRLADRVNGEWQEYETVMVRHRGLRVWIDRDNAYYCDSCDNYVHEDNYAGDDRCTDCYSSHDDYSDYCDCEECNGSDVGSPMPVRCNGQTVCPDAITHWHPITEAVSCETHAVEGSELIPMLVAA